MPTMKGQPSPLFDAFGRVVQPMTADEHAVFHAVKDQAAATKRGVMSLDMTNDVHRRFVLDRFGGDDFMERYFPTARHLIETTRRTRLATGKPPRQTLLEMDEPTVGEWQSMVNVSYIGVERENRVVTAQGVVTLTGTATVIAANLVLTDDATGAQIASSSIPQQYNSTTQIIEVSGVAPDEGGDLNVTATLTAMYLPAGGTLADMSVATASIVGANAVQSITVLNPNHDSHPDRDYIKVALNRTPGQVGDCDYYYNYGTDGSKPIVGLQVNGSAQLVNGYTVAANPNFNGSCVLMRRSGTGDGATLAFPEDQIPGLCNGSGSAVSWNIGPDWFQGAPWDQGNTIDLDFVLNFSITPGGSTFVRVTSVPQGVTTPPTNIATVAPMQFVWGCVATGTLVRMADGGRRPIESLSAGERVAGANGTSLRIAEIWRGHEDKPLYRLVTACGAEVLVTDGHPVPTAAGVMAAADLRPGMIVETAGGPVALALVETVSHDGAVLNLDLLPDGVDALTDIDDDTVTAFDAGGIMVGDNRMQGVLNRQAMAGTTADPLDSLGTEWRLDILNSRRMAAGLSLLERLTN
ncbi:hypothetical protein P7L78_02615 (plasmid) [Tistrella bauzanensis]|uniref:Hint domain-containing protein n=1 Tax=Tistrella TaxID=171436 RepID=UPI0031F720C8